MFDLHQADVSRLIARMEPAEIRDHSVEIRGRRYPVKQALGVATGLDPSDFTSQHVRSALRRLGLPVGRLSTVPTGRATSRRGIRSTSRPRGQTTDHAPTATSNNATPAELATALRGYRDRWVAIQRNHLLTDQDTFSDTVAWLRSNSVKADAVFLVPGDPERIRQPRSRIRDGVPPEEESLSTRDSTRST